MCSVCGVLAFRCPPHCNLSSFQHLASQAFLDPIFRVFSTHTWHAVVNCAIIALMMLGWNDVCNQVVQIWLLLLLVADAAATSVFHTIVAQGFEIHNQVRKKTGLPVSAPATHTTQTISDPTTCGAWLTFGCRGDDRIRACTCKFHGV